MQERSWRRIRLRIKKKALEYRVLRMRDKLDNLLRRGDAHAGEAAAGLLDKLERAIARLSEAEKAVREEMPAGKQGRRQE